MRKTFAIIITALLTWVSGCKHDSVYQPDPPPPPVVDDTSCVDGVIYFENDVMPILLSSCAYMGCHDAVTKEGEVDLTTYESIMNSADVEAGNPNGSDLYEVLNETDTTKRMPYNLPALSAEKIEIIRKWIEQGAENNSCKRDCDTNVFTYSGAIQPILDKFGCIGCHSPSALNGGVDLSTYDGVKAVVDDGRLKSAVFWEGDASKNMPQGATEKLDACYLLQIENWINDGAPND